MSAGIPFDAFLAGATRYEWCCMDCPRLYVTHAGAIKHSIVKRHDYAGREYLAGFGKGDGEPHPFVAGNVYHEQPKRKTVACCFCWWERAVHDARQERLRPLLLAELRWTLRALRKQRALYLITGLYGLPLVDTVSSGMAYVPP